MIFYPYNNPIILTDAIFAMYGGETGTSTAGQKQAAYLGAEVEMTGWLGTYLLPTSVTGSFPYPIHNQPIMLDHTYIHAINSVTLFDDLGISNDLLSSNGCGVVFDNTWGYVHVRDVWGSFHHALSPDHYTVEIGYTAGLPSGTSYNPLMLQSLTTLADILLKDMVDPFALEGGAGDPGINSWSDMSHSETRRFGTGAQTSLGTSPRAVAAMRRVGHLVKTKRALRF